MVVSRVTRVVNRGRVAKRRIPPTVRKKSVRKHRPAGNPAHLLHLGYINPKRSKSVASTTRRRRRNARRATSRVYRATHNRRRRHHTVTNRRRHNRRTHNPTRRVVVMARRHNRRHRAHNPAFLHGMKPMQVLQGAAGVLAGVAATKAIVGMLPAAATSSNIVAAASSIAVAIGVGWLGGMVNPQFGLAALYGGIAQAGSQLLNEYIPSVGSVVGLSGVRANLGDFVPGRFTVPQNPILDGNPQLPTGGMLMSKAYPAAYGVAA